MRRFALMAAGVALVAAAPALSQGKGNGNGGGPPQGKGDGGPGKGNGGPGRGDGGPGKGNGGPGRGDAGPGRGTGGLAMADRGPPARAGRGEPGGPGRRDEVRGADRRADRGPPPGRGTDRGPEREVRGLDYGPVAGFGPGDRGPGPKGKGRDARGAGPARYVDGGRWYDAGPVLIDGCPPGLARKGNGCLPPGQARRIWGNPQPWDNWYGWSNFQRNPGYDYRYSDGYLYQVDSGSNLVSAFLPLLGGALFGGNAWPQGYADAAVPQYYDDYFGYDDALDYRYADGAILGVNPSSGAIDQIAALLTGSNWAVGQAMPAGYDFYNVPPQFRDRYADRDDAWYRYSDGYVYQVDPQSRLVEQVIQLLG